MSLYTFAAANLTTADDRKRCPAVDKGQVIRTIAFCLTLAAALLVMAHRQSQAAESGLLDGLRFSRVPSWHLPR